MTFYYWFRAGTQSSHGAIYCEIRIDGEKSVPISTKIKVARKNWNAKEQCFEGKDSAKHTRIIDFWELRFRQIYNEIISEKPNDPIIPNEILQRHRDSLDIENNIRRFPTFLECFKSFLKIQDELHQSSKISQRTIDGFYAKYSVIKSYLVKLNKDKIKSDEITELFCDTFKHYLITQQYEDSTIEKYLFILKRVTSFSFKKGLSKKNNIEEYKIEKAKEKAPVSLTKFELDKLDNLHLNDRLRKTVDIYRFCAETSLSYCDYDGLCSDELETDEEGTLWIILNRDKSDTGQRIPLNNKAIEIFNKYGGSVETLPKMSNSKLNDYIKEVIRKTDIKKHITFHTSRKSFVDHSLNELELPQTTIQAIVGWKNSRQLSRYAKVKNSTIKRQFLKKDEE